MIRNHFRLIFEKFKGYYNLRNVEGLKKLNYKSEEDLGYYKVNLYKYLPFIAYLVAIAIAEILISFYDIKIGILIYFFVMLSILIHSSYTKSYKFNLFLRSLLIIPIIRVISLEMLLFMKLDNLYGILLISILIFSASYSLIKIQNFNSKDVGLLVGNIQIQIAIAVSGIFLGVIEYLILRPAPLIASFNIELLVIVSAILVISAGFAEELLFRGIIQKNAQNLLGNNYGLIFASLIFTSLYIGWKSPQLLIFIFIVAMFYGYLFQKSKSIVGISISHSLANVFLFLILPFLWISS